MTEAVFFGARVLTGGILVVAIAGKARDFRSFQSAVRAFDVVPRSWERRLALTVICGEVVAALLLTTRESAVVGLCLAIVLLTAFAAAIVRVLARGGVVACGCFGSSTVPIGGMHVVRNAVIACAGVAGVVAGTRPGGEPLDAAQLGLVSAFAVTGAVLCVLMDQLLAISTPAGATAARRSSTQRHPAAAPGRITGRVPMSATPTTERNHRAQSTR